ncbi:AP-1 complex subunit mu-2, partial [Tanacetum coccineum]
MPISHRWIRFCHTDCQRGNPCLCHLCASSENAPEKSRRVVSLETVSRLDGCDNEFINAWPNTLKNCQGPGKCFCLYPESRFEGLDNSTVPEIKRCNILNVILQLSALGVDDIIGFDFMEKHDRYVENDGRMPPYYHMACQTVGYNSDDINAGDFDLDFVWGAATSAYQFIKTDAYKLEVTQRPPMAVTNAVSWRNEGIHYKKNEVFLDVIESINILVNSNRQIIRSEVVGALKMKTCLSKHYSSATVHEKKNSFDDLEGMAATKSFEDVLIEVEKKLEECFTRFIKMEECVTQMHQEFSLWSDKLFKSVEAAEKEK